jgi:tetratricopeptide (TPR) repeat protein
LEKGEKMAWLKEGAYQKQIILYLNNRAFRQAFDFSAEYANAYPQDMVAHFLLAKSAIKIERYGDAAEEARKAYNLAKDESDMTMCAIHACVAYYRLGEYQKGFELLKTTEFFEPCQELEELCFLFCLALDRDIEATKHFKRMFDLNQEAANRFVMSVAEGVPIDYDKILKSGENFPPR